MRQHVEETECGACGADVVVVLDRRTGNKKVFWSHPIPNLEHVCEHEPPCGCGAMNPHCADEKDGLESRCGGFGVLHCYCGGDFCVCHNHGEVPCYGCEDCEELADDNDDDLDWSDW